MASTKGVGETRPTQKVEPQEEQKRAGRKNKKPEASAVPAAELTEKAKEASDELKKIDRPPPAGTLKPEKGYANFTSHAYRITDPSGNTVRGIAVPKGEVTVTVSNELRKDGFRPVHYHNRAVQQRLDSDGVKFYVRVDQYDALSDTREMQGHWAAGRIQD